MAKITFSMREGTYDEATGELRLVLERMTDEPIPAAPEAFVASATGQRSIGLSWLDRANNEARFELYIKTMVPGALWGFVAALKPDLQSFLVDNLQPDTAYAFRLRTRNSAGPSAFVEATATTLKEIVPTPVEPPTIRQKMGMIVPAYFDPERHPQAWDQLIGAAARIPLEVIINPADGPWTSKLPDYDNAVKALAAAGGLSFGYVSTRYTGRPIAECKAEIDRYFAWYGVDGIFLDEVTNDTDLAHLAYYRELQGAVLTRAPAALVMLNPGTNCPEPYRLLASRICIFETYAQAFTAWVPEPWMTRADPNQLSMLAYERTAAQMVPIIESARSKGVKWVYVTDDTRANPWDTLPTYFAAEVDLVSGLTV
jgi:hypothetical protein